MFNWKFSGYIWLAYPSHGNVLEVAQEGPQWTWRWYNAGIPCDRGTEATMEKAKEAAERSIAPYI